MANECESVSIKYQGNGVQKLFTFPFTYMAWKDVQVFLYDETNKTWVNQENKFIQANATTVEFFTPPPAPTDREIDNVWIARLTDLEAMLVTFYPGSSIRAADLNDDFDQLRLAIQENRCAVETLKDETLENVYTKDQYFTRPDQETAKWIPDGDQMLPATSGAIAARHDVYVRETKPAEPDVEQPGKGWQNTDDCWSSYWNPEAETWVAYVNTGPRGQQGPQGPPGQSIVGPPGPEGPAGPNGGTFPDAPSDGKVYGRKDANWEVVTNAGGGGGKTYNFLPPLEETGDNVSLNLLLLNNA